MKMVETVINARTEAIKATSIETKLKAETVLTENIGSLLNMAEKYPDIRSESHFKDLRIALTDVENRITASRRFYNLAVDEFNATRRQFPGIFIANSKGLASRKHFDLGNERIFMDEPVAIKF
jgi:LemA protein